MTHSGDTSDARRLFHEYRGIHEELEAESDRAAAILGASYLDSLLEKLLSLSAPTAAVGKKFMEGGDSGLASFSSRIDVAYMLGLLPEGVYQDLRVLRKIRNDFAHKLTYKNFRDGPMRDRLRNLYVTRAISDEELNAYEDISRRIHRQAINSIRQELIFRIDQAVRRPEPEANSPVYAKAAKGEKVLTGPIRPKERGSDIPQPPVGRRPPTPGWYYVESNATREQLEIICDLLRARFGVEPRFVTSVAGRVMLEFPTDEPVTHDELRGFYESVGAKSLMVARYEGQTDPDVMY